jgi:hypothetical protein
MSSNNTADQPGFIRKQYEFASHIRNPDKNPCPPDVEQRRMNIYNELFYNNVEGFMSNTFPVLRSLHDDDSWHALIRDYFEHHKAHTPLFPELPREFLKFLEAQPESANEFPFIEELAHYEWVELALAVSDKTIEDQSINPQGDLLSGKPVLSPLAWLLSYQYPVHQISPDFIPEQAGESTTFIIAYRDMDDEVHFLEVNPISAHLVNMITEQPGLTGQQLLDQIADQLPQLDRNLVLNGGIDTLKSLREKNILIGTR